MKLKYDLHIHTALSPCAQDEMTPNNIVNMALINELDVIAITDHNSCKNVEAVIKAAEETGLLVIPGMEIESREEIHIVALFFCPIDVYNVQDVIYQHLPRQKNTEKVFGKQLLFNAEDDIVGVEDKLLTFATDLSINEVFQLVRSHNGVPILAHIDRKSYSVISNLGSIPENLQAKTLEISMYSNCETFAEIYSDYQLIQNSDAHELGYIGVCQNFIETDNKSITSILKKLM